MISRRQSWCELLWIQSCRFHSCGVSRQPECKTIRQLPDCHQKLQLVMPRKAQKQHSGTALLNGMQPSKRLLWETRERRTGRDGTDWTRPPRPRCSEGWAPDSFSFLFFSFAKLNWLWELKMQVSARQWVNTPSDEVKALPVYRWIQDGLRLMSGSSPVSAGFPPSQSPTSRTRVYCFGSGMHVINQKVITLRVKTNIYKQMKMLM